jgi:hypothetical protein
MPNPKGEPGMQPLRVVTPLRDFPVTEQPDDEVKRPFRLWNSTEKKQLQWAFFKSLRHAHMRALCEAAWAHEDTVIEVFDLRNGGLRGQYAKRGQTIQFWRSNHHLEEN